MAASKRHTNCTEVEEEERYLLGHLMTGHRHRPQLWCQIDRIVVAATSQYHAVVGDGQGDRYYSLSSGALGEELYILDGQY